MTRLEIARRRAQRRKARPVSPPLKPSGIQLSYFRELRKLIRSAKARVDERVVPLLPELTARASSLRQDALDPTKRINKLLDRISESFYREWDPERTAGIARQAATATSEFQKTQLRRQLSRSLGIDPLGTREPGLAQRVKDFTGANVALIKRMSDTYLGQVEQKITDGIRGGERHEDIATQLEHEFDLTETRAQLIARDQVGKFVGELNQFRQEALGIDQYIWRTVHDERVRNAHTDFDGNTYDWDDPPGDGSAEEGDHPGSGINCRCWAEGIIPELESDPD